MASRRRVAVQIVGHGQYGREVAQGIIGYSLGHADWEIHYEGVTDPTAVERIAAAITDWPADGAILQVMNSQLANAISLTGIPVVLIHGEENDRASVVCPDNVAVGCTVAKYFVDRGLRQLAYCGVMGGEYSQQREDGFCAEARKSDRPTSVIQYRYLARNSRDWISDHRTMEQWLRDLPKPVGLMACNDSIGKELVAMCCHLGLRVPDDVAVVGVDNDSVECAMSRVPLSSVRLPTGEIGFTAARVLDEMMDARKPKRESVRLPPTMIVTRRSSDIYTTEQEDVRAALGFVRDNASTPITVEDVLRQVPVSRRWLEKQFVAVLGRTIRQEILRAHAEYAQRLLIDTDLKIAVVGRRSGYSEYQVFPKLFRQTTGLLPSEFRRRYGHAATQATEASAKTTKHTPRSEA